MLKKLLIPIGIVILVIAAAFGVLKFKDIFTNDNQSVLGQTSPEPTANNEGKQAIPLGFDSTLYSIDKPDSIWVVVNKTRPLPDGYVPSDLVIPDVKLRLSSSNEQMKYSNKAAPALKKMFDAAKKDDVTLVFGSGYRSEALQRQFYEGYVAQDGQAEADRLSARPGTSEHQTGLSFDATSISQSCHLEECFADLDEGKWLAANAYKYGFIVRYPDGKEPITGYAYEPWHMRYVGVELATEMHDTEVQTMEEFFKLPPAPTYP